MAGRLLQRLRTKDPALLVQQCHQAFTRLPFEANHERIAEELSKFLAAMKVRAAGAQARLAPLPLLGSRACAWLQGQHEALESDPDPRSMSMRLPQLRRRVPPPPAAARRRLIKRE